MLRVVLVSALAAAALVLAGCTSTTSPPSSSHIRAASPSPSVALGCADLLPRVDAAALLKLPATQLTDSPYPKDSTPSTGATASAMLALARAHGGVLQCRWRTGTDTTGATAVSLAAIGDAASAFATYQPDSDDGLKDLAPAEIGDRAYLGCRTGETDECRAEVLVGTTWFSFAVAPRPADRDAFEARARSIAKALSAHPLAAVAPPARPDCGTLLTPGALAKVGALEHGVEDDLTPTGVNPGDGMDQLSLVRGGLTACGAVFARGATFESVQLYSLDGDAANWTVRPPGADTSSIPLEPLTGIGVRAVGGCAGRDCQLDVIVGERWLVFEGSGAKVTLDALRPIAEGAVQALARG